LHFTSSLYDIFYPLKSPPPKNSFNNECDGTISFEIGSKYLNISINLCASAYSFSSFVIFSNNGIASFLNTPNSYINDVLNMLSASSWNGNIFFSSPLFTLSHVAIVF